VAAVNLPLDASRVVVRAPREGESVAIARLWRELWEAHESWGSYAASTDPRVYAEVADRLEYDARARGGSPTLGRHAHLVAVHGADVVGQVEGWIERHGADRVTPVTCEVRSLIVRSSARIRGVGRALLAELGEVARATVPAEGSVLAAEVLDPNPARAFYERVGYRPVAWTVRFDAKAKPLLPDPKDVVHRARIAQGSDALAIAILDGVLAARRRILGDTRFDRPRAIDATLVGAIAAHLNRQDTATSQDSAEIVIVDSERSVRAVASLAMGDLLPPFVPMKRALLGRIATDPSGPVKELLVPLVAYAWQLARMRGAVAMEVTDLPPPGSPLHTAMVELGGKPWSRVVLTEATSGRAPVFRT